MEIEKGDIEWAIGTLASCLAPILIDYLKELHKKRKTKRKPKKHKRRKRR